jgi:hypothetical protein
MADSRKCDKCGTTTSDFDGWSWVNIGTYGSIGFTSFDLCNECFKSYNPVDGVLSTFKKIFLSFKIKDKHEHD